MYLLNRLRRKKDKTQFIVFTFHYVSIKSNGEIMSFMYIWNLHSTMYLLNRETEQRPQRG